MPSCLQAGNRLGPPVYGVGGCKAGSAPSYGNCSGTMRGPGVTRKPESIDGWVATPETFIYLNNRSR